MYWELTLKTHDGQVVEIVALPLDQVSTVEFTTACPKSGVQQVHGFKFIPDVRLLRLQEVVQTDVDRRMREM